MFIRVRQAYREAINVNVHHLFRFVRKNGYALSNYACVQPISRADLGSSEQTGYVIVSATGRA